MAWDSLVPANTSAYYFPEYELVRALPATSTDSKAGIMPFYDSVKANLRVNSGATDKAETHDTPSSRYPEELTVDLKKFPPRILLGL